MLEHCTISPPLGTAANLMIAQQHVARGTTLEAEERLARVLLGGIITESRRYAETGKGFDETSMHRLIKFIASGRQRVAAGQNDAISQFVVVQDRAAAGEPPHGRAVLASSMSLTIRVSLEIAQRERGLVPAVDSQTRGNSSCALSSSTSSTAMFHAPAAGSWRSRRHSQLMRAAST